MVLRRPPRHERNGFRPAASQIASLGRRAARECWLYGRHPVVAALANPRRCWRRLAALAGQEDEARALVAAAAARRRHHADDAVLVLDRGRFAAMLPPGAVHQGLAIEVEPLPPTMLEDVLGRVESAAGTSIVVALDQVSDPHNVGAVLRSAAAFGAAGLLLAAHGAPPIGGVLAKAASGALERVPLIHVVNLARALDRLKRARFWVCGLDETASQPLGALNLDGRVALVLGSEGKGLRRLVRERCDYLARLPTLAAQPTLNVSNAAAVALYEVVRAKAAG